MRTKKIFTPIISMLLLLTMLFSLTACGNHDVKNDLQEFYDVTSESAELLDDVADDIYSCWYDYVYEDRYWSINSAIAAALSMSEEALLVIEENDIKIGELYKKVRDSDYSERVEKVMNCYSDYYEFVVNVSGSFKTFSADIETKKKALSAALKALSFEL